MESRKRASNTKSLIVTNDEEISERGKQIADLEKNALYDTKEACDLLDISKQSLRRAIAAGKIKTVRLGRFLRIPAEEIEKLAKGESVLLTYKRLLIYLMLVCI